MKNIIYCTMNTTVYIYKLNNNIWLHNYSVVTFILSLAEDNHHDQESEVCDGSSRESPSVEHHLQ